MITTTKKAAGEMNSNGMNTDTNGANFRTAGAAKQTPIGVFTRSGSALRIDPPPAHDRFRTNGQHFELVGGRRARRAQERQELKAKKAGKP